jgi:ribose 5-phosphate isomerase A
VDRLGSTFALPVEVVRWGWEAHARYLERCGAEVVMRAGADRMPAVSDNGHVFLDCRFPGGIGDPHALEDALVRRAGIVETGLFLGLATEAVVASADEVRVIRRIAR